MPSVSIIIPAYNPGGYLREAIRSVHEQTYADWELVMVDDNSSENLGWVTQEFPRVRMIRQAHGGASVARNNGILNSSGELIAFMDQDDVWRPEKLARQAEVMEGDASVGVCHCDLELIDAEGRLMGEGRKDEPVGGAVVELDGAAEGEEKAGGVSRLHRSVLHFSSRFVVPSTVMVRRTALATSGLLDPFIPFSGDYDLLIKLGSRHKVVRVPHADVLYRKHGNNFSDQYEVGRGEVKALIARYGAYARAKGDLRLAREVGRLFGRPRRVYAAQAFDCARRSFRKREWVALTRHLGRALWFSPGFVLGSASKWMTGRFTKRRASAG